MPVNITPLSDETIARGVQAADFSKFDPFGSYFAGQDRAQQQALQNAFSGGLPRDPATGQVDWGKVGDLAARLQGLGGIQNVISLQNLDELRKLPPIGSSGSPSQQPSLTPQREVRPAQRVDVPSTQRSTLATEPPAGSDDERTLRPDQPGNIGEVIGVERGPVETTPFPSRPVATVPVPSGSAGAMPAPQFAPTPTNAPPADRFADHPVSQRVAQAQAQPAPSQIPGIPTQPQGSFNEAAAKEQDVIAATNIEAARRASMAGNNSMAQDYRAVAVQAAARASAIREGLIKTQVKQGETQVEQEKAILDEGKKGYGAGQDIQFRLGLIDKSIKELGPNWLGSGANTRAAAARSYNTTLNFVPEAIRSELGLAPINPQKIASWEDFNKQSLNLGFALARTLGAREAMQIVQQATASVPNAEQSYWGARLVSGAMRQAAQREIDYHKYLIQQRRSGNSLLDADVTFNQQHPVQSYVDRATSLVPPQRAIDFLQANPTPQNKQAFDKKYGDGATIGVFGTQ